MGEIVQYTVPVDTLGRAILPKLSHPFRLVSVLITGFISATVLNRHASLSIVYGGVVTAWKSIGQTIPENYVINQCWSNANGSSSKMVQTLPNYILADANGVPDWILDDKAEVVAELFAIDGLDVIDPVSFVVELQ